MRWAVVSIVWMAVTVLLCGVWSAKWMRDAMLESRQLSMTEQLETAVHVLSQQGNTRTDAAQRDDRRTRLTELQTLFKQADVDITNDASPIVAESAGGTRFVIRDHERLQVTAMYLVKPLDGTDRISRYFGDATSTRDYLVYARSVEDVKQSVRTFWTLLFLSLALVVLIAAAIAWRMAGRYAVAIEQVAEITKKYTTFQFREQAVEHERDELGRLGLAVNTMGMSVRHRIRTMQRQEQRLTSVLDNMVTAIILLDERLRISLLNRRAEQMLDYQKSQWIGQHYSEMKHPVELTLLIEQALNSKHSIREEMTIYYPAEHVLEIHIIPLSADRDQNQGLMVMLHEISTIRKLEMMRREFVANVSHEIKTPLTALKGFAETLLSGALDDRETARSFLQIIHNEADRLNRLIVDILQLSKMESGQYPLHFTPIELGPFVANLQKMMLTEAKKKSIAIHTEVREGLFIEADEDRLLQILINLVSNAIAYTPHGGYVELSAASVPDDDSMIEIIVSDTGVGIPKQDQQRIFERFYRVDKARARDSGGTGLGLAIVKHLVELHHGTITVDSRPGMGTSFAIKLPVIQH